MLFRSASVLRRDSEGRYLLETPAEKGVIEVEDAPFLAVELSVEGIGRSRRLIFRTNIDENVVADIDHPLRVVTDPSSGEPNPYVMVRDGLEARLARPVYYELVELGDEALNMFEHVGERYWPDYFQTIRKRLKPNGRALIQSITLDDHLFESLHDYAGFLEQVIFPGGMLPSKSRLQEAMAAAGLGVGFLSVHACTLEVRNHLLSVLRVPGVKVQGDWHVMHKEARAIPTVAASFHEFMVEHGQQLISDELESFAWR